jgi:predicted acylesterase/phospholipase RssA
MKKALVLSGGGAKGSWSGGIIEYLVKEQNKKWDLVIGTSTGSLLSPLSAIGEIDRLKEAYTTVDNKSIFNIEPFNEKGKVRLFNALWRVLTKKTSLGQANNLKKKIKEIITEEDYNRIRNENKEAIAVVSNMTKFKSELKSTKTETYDSFCEWLLCSSSVPLLFEVQNNDSCEYLDGGVLNTVPLQDAINLGATEIDVIILSAEVNKDYPQMNNMWEVFMRTIDFMNKEINKDDIMLGKLTGEQMEVKINIYRTPISLTKNSIIFNKEQMLQWWAMGYEFARSHFEVKEVSLKRTKTNPEYKIKSIIEKGKSINK